MSERALIHRFRLSQTLAQSRVNLKPPQQIINVRPEILYAVVLQTRGEGGGEGGEGGSSGFDGDEVSEGGSSRPPIQLNLICADWLGQEDTMFLFNTHTNTHTLIQSFLAAQTLWSHSQISE